MNIIIVIYVFHYLCTEASCQNKKTLVTSGQNTLVVG